MQTSKQDAAPKLGPLARLTADGLAEIINGGLSAGLGPVVKALKETRQENRELRAEPDALKAEVQALRAKSHGGALMLARR